MSAAERHRQEIPEVAGSFVIFAESPDGENPERIYPPEGRAFARADVAEDARGFFQAPNRHRDLRTYRRINGGWEEHI